MYLFLPHALQAASTPEGQNDHKRNQLRELASLNGTLRDDENQLCQNCGEKGHRKYECPQARSFTANIICRACGNGEPRSLPVFHYRAVLTHPIIFFVAQPATWHGIVSSGTDLQATNSADLPESEVLPGRPNLLSTANTPT